jgi:hypothetical protein
MSRTARLLQEFILEKIEGESLGRRIVLKRALAHETTDKTLALRLNALADDLEQIEARHRQLVLDFKRRAEG